MFAHHADDPNPFDGYPGEIRGAMLRRLRWGQRAYRLYLRSDAWRAKRAAVLERCGRVCENCGAGSGLFPVSLDVHHLTYAHIGNEQLEDLRALCRDCHEAEHDELRLVG